MLKTYKYVNVIVSKHNCVLPRTQKPIKGTISISVRQYMLICDRQVTWKKNEDIELK